MSNKNISQSITEAWKTAVETGQRLDENKQKREQEVSKVFDNARADAIQHVLEYDHGFYRPDVDPFFSAVDGGMLRRQRLAEQQAPMPIEGAGGGAGGAESEEVRKEVEKRMAEIKKRDEEEFNRRNQENIEREREERGEISQDRVDQAYTGSLTADGGDRAGRGREGLIRARGGNAQDIDTARRRDDARAEAEGRQRFEIAGGRGGYYYGDARITDNQGRTQAERDAQRKQENEDREARALESALNNLKGLDDDRRASIEDMNLTGRKLADEIRRQRYAQDRVSGHRDSGRDEGDYDPNTGRLTDSGKAKDAARREETRAKREKNRAIRDARKQKAQDREDAQRNERLARRAAVKAGKPYTRPGAGKTEKPDETDDRTIIQQAGDALGIGGGRTTGENVAAVGDIGRTVLGGPGQVAIPPGVPELVGAGVDIVQGLMGMDGKDQKQTPPATTQTPQADTNLQSSEATQAALRKRMEDARKRANA